MKKKNMKKAGMKKQMSTESEQGIKRKIDQGAIK